MRDFRKYQVWQHGIELVKKVYAFTAELPSEEKYSLTRQIQRSSVSIPSNVAEGCARTSEKEFKHYIEVALGSAFELETQMILASSLYSIPTDGQYQTVYHLLMKVQAKLNTLRNTLNNGNKDDQ
jgi:four helix bundle protein